MNYEDLDPSYRNPIDELTEKFKLMSEEEVAVRLTELKLIGMKEVEFRRAAYSALPFINEFWCQYADNQYVGNRDSVTINQYMMALKRALGGSGMEGEE